MIEFKINPTVQTFQPLTVTLVIKSQAELGALRRAAGMAGADHFKDLYLELMNV